VAPAAEAVTMFEAPVACTVAFSATNGLEVGVGVGVSSKAPSYRLSSRASTAFLTSFDRACPLAN